MRVFFHLLLNAALGPASRRGQLSLLAALGIMLALLQRLDLTSTATRCRSDAAGILAILLIAALVNYGLYAAL